MAHNPPAAKAETVAVGESSMSQADSFSSSEVVLGAYGGLSGAGEGGGAGDGITGGGGGA